MAKDEPADEEDHRGDDDRHPDPEDRSLAEPDHHQLVIDMEDGVALIGHREGEATGEEQCRQGHDEGGHPGPRDEQAVDRPMSPHTPSGRAIAATLPYCEPYAASTADRARSDPTDRSIPPPMITNVIPTATSPRNELASRMFRKLSTLANRVPKTRMPRA